MTSTKTDLVFTFEEGEVTIEVTYPKDKGILALNALYRATNDSEILPTLIGGFGDDSSILEALEALPEEDEA